MRRFEFSEGTSNKFWEVSTTGSELRIRFGKIGSDGQTKLKQLASPAAAAAEMAKLIAEKTRKGYAEAGGAKNGAAKNGATKPAGSNVKPTELAFTTINVNIRSIQRIHIDGKFAICAGSNGTIASTDGKNFHRRTNPGNVYCLTAADGWLYACGGPISRSNDRGATWRSIGNPTGWGNVFAIKRDSKGTWWLCCDDGVVMTTKSPEKLKSWKKAKFKTPGKCLDMVEVDDKLIFIGAGSGAWNGKSFKALSGIKKSDTISRLAVTPSGALVAIGDAGVVFRSTNRGVSWKKVKSGVKTDLEDFAWVAGALFVVGADGVILRSTNEGESFTRVKGPLTDRIWGIASWGDGAFLGTDGGSLCKLAAPNDPYWRGCDDEMKPPPIELDASFSPMSARTHEERERTYAKLYAEALQVHEGLSAKLRRTFAGSGANVANAKLAQEVDEHGDDAMQVYADWLQDQGDPRGELAQVQLRLAKDPKNKALKKTEKALLKTHAETFLGKLVNAGKLLELEWRAGFIYKARLAASYDYDYGGDDEDGEEGENKTKPLDVVETLDILLSHPSARFMRELVIGLVGTDGENSYGRVNKILAKHYLPALRTLVLGDFTQDESEVSWSYLDNLAPVWAAVPNLTTLKLKSGTMTFGSIVLPKLESFEVETGGLGSKEAKAIATARWPGLKSLVIQTGSSDYGSNTTLKDLQPVLDGNTLPRLEKLAIANSEFTTAAVAAVASSKILPQLETLSFEDGTLGDDGAGEIYRLQKAFRHLSALHLDNNFVSREGKKLLAKAKLNVELGRYQRDDGGDPGDRYVALGE
jgi:uncharacterized protein (TIGR02996 family)